MKIQINCDSNVSEDDLRYIYYNKDRLIEEYELNKKDAFFYKYINGKRTYYKHLKGSFMVSTNIDMTCNGRTMYFKIKRCNNAK
ncbi:MAG: hypothetical protein HFJ50_06435 [Clostridia bacterium]|jgi:hypothetical protein|nr:hypothetical protein [Clostridia bacterium]